MSAEDHVREQVTRLVRHIDPDIGSALDRISRRGRRRRRLAVAAKVSVAAGLIALIGIAGPWVLDIMRTSPIRPGSPVSPYSVIAGTYRATIASEPGVVDQAGMTGPWTMRLDPDGSLDLVAPPGFRAETSGITYRLVGQEFQTNAFPNDLCHTQLPGRYEWTRAGGQLRFTIVEDSCKARSILFAGESWSEDSRSHVSTANASRLFTTERRTRRSPMQGMRTMICSGMLVALFACTGGSSNSAESSTPGTAPASGSTSAPATTSLEGMWRSVLDARSLDQRGFSAKQIHNLQAQDEWSSRQVNEIRIDGDTWVLLQGVDGETPTAHADFGQISVTPERIRLDEGVCFLVLTYRLNGDEIQMTLVRSTCDEDPTEPIPDFMYSAVFGQPYSRQA